MQRYRIVSKKVLKKLFDGIRFKEEDTQTINIRITLKIPFLWYVKNHPYKIGTKNVDDFCRIVQVAN